MIGEIIVKEYAKTKNFSTKFLVSNILQLIAIGRLGQYFVGYSTWFVLNAKLAKLAFTECLTFLDYLLLVLTESIKTQRKKMYRCSATVV